ncbi:GspB domain-containing protein [Salinimonas sp. HHU 13199]|uniref:GspB domain-containing protein n=1 Tax=Salinimonas profundi TaxID=2729140 RepID=A0ABR8LGR6_9ALTE|nr:general secretion pathway protein GspB [Salinimonas profundi]MBD3585453.1 GspB domain-containing protein [Salinimonas profundi]
MSKLVGIEALRPGMVITRITRQNGPVNIRKSGLVSSQAMVEGLAEMGVQEVEIDPEQTVEIDARLNQRTHTQQLLRGDHDKRSGVDKNLTEQFNRSLFLPSVQSLPGAWRRSSKLIGAYLLLTLLGGLIGFAGGTSHIWWPRLMQDTAETVSGSAPSADKTPPEITRDTPVAKDATVAKQNNDTGSVPDEDATTAPESSQTETQAQQQAQNAPPVEDGVDNTVANEQNNDEAALTNQQATEATDDYEGTVLNQPDVPTQGQVSQELLDKFNKAIEDLDSDEASAEQPAETPVTVSQDIQRVDQLPVRMLTRLPTMKFSAHMYASNPADRWVRVNGNQLGEGDWIADKVQIVAIQGQRVVLEFENERFTMAALTDW